MALNKQIYLYSLDTSCFYTDEEMVLHKKIIRLRSIRLNVREKLERLEARKATIERKTNDGSFKEPEETTSITSKRKKISMMSLSEVCEKIELFNDILNRLNVLIYPKTTKLKSMLIEFKKTGETRVLREDSVNHKNIASMFESSTGRVCGIENNSLTDNIMIIQTYYFEVAEDIVKNGFLYNGEKYVLYTASAGQIRTKKFVAIKESLYKKVKPTLMCGINEDIINSFGGANTNKFLAYLALNNSATDLWCDFDIDRAIVVDDFETMIETEVDYIDDLTYKIERKTMSIPIPHMDGCGIMLDKTRMARLPWMKGLMAEHDFVKTLKKWGHSGDVTDIYGDSYNIFNDNIRYIFTKSQFKMWKYYKNWSDYKAKFKENNCEASYCNIEESFISDSNLNYQMLQTLTDITDEELAAICKKTINNISNVGNDYRTMCRILGVGKDGKLYRQKALAIYPEMIRNKFTKEKIKQIKAKIVKEALSGRLQISGKYTFVIPDLYAFCEWLFLGIKNPKGLLENGQVYCNLYENGEDLDCLRSPHLYREHAVRKNIISDELAEHFITKGIYTSVHDPISKILQFDCDGDKLLVTNEKVLVNVAKRNMVGIVPLYYNMKIASSEFINNESLYDGLDKSYRGGKIGKYSNDISKLWNTDNAEEFITIIKLLCMENNFSIDEAKTLYMPERTDYFKEIMKKITKKKVPHFFIYAKDKEKNEVEKINNSTVNRLEKIIPEKRVRLNKSIGQFKLSVLMNDTSFVWENGHESVIGNFKLLNKKYIINGNFENAENKPEHELWPYQQVRKEMLDSIDNIKLCVDILIYHIYNSDSFGLEKTLWASFGDIIYENINKNTQGMGDICPVCGKRIKLKKGQHRKKYCSEECYKVVQKEGNKITKKNTRKKNVT